MAGLTGQRLRLTTSRKPSYRRAGVKIGTHTAPTFVDPGEIEPEQLLAILRDRAIAIAVEEEDGHFAPLTDQERGLVTAAAEPQPNTAEPQGEGTAPDGSDPDAQASQAGGPDATADGSVASAGDAAPTEPTAQTSPAAPEPAAAPKPASRAPAKKAKGTAT